MVGAPVGGRPGDQRFADFPVVPEGVFHATEAPAVGVADGGDFSGAGGNGPRERGVGILPALPAILGNGIGGVVAAVGASVEASRIGRRVVSSLRGTGGYAARAVADAEALIDVPDDLDMDQAVALLADGRTALLLAQQAAIRSGETALVLAAAGGVGSLLVQLAQHAGARVIGAVGGAAKLDTAREVGADVVVHYSTPEWPSRVRAEIAGVDVVFDGVGGSIGRAAFELLRSGGRFVQYGMASGAFTTVPEGDAATRGVRVVRGGAPAPEHMRALPMLTRPWRGARPWARRCWSCEAR